jgi:hypothetical protein
MAAPEPIFDILYPGVSGMQVFCMQSTFLQGGYRAVLSNLHRDMCDSDGFCPSLFAIDDGVCPGKKEYAERVETWFKDFPGMEWWFGPMADRGKDRAMRTAAGWGVDDMIVTSTTNTRNVTVVPVDFDTIDVVTRISYNAGSIIKNHADRVAPLLLFPGGFTADSDGRTVEELLADGGSRGGLVGRTAWWVFVENAWSRGQDGPSNYDMTVQLNPSARYDTTRGAPLLKDMMNGVVYPRSAILVQGVVYGPGSVKHNFWSPASRVADHCISWRLKDAQIYRFARSLQDTVSVELMWDSHVRRNGYKSAASAMHGAVDRAEYVPFTFKNGPAEFDAIVAARA